MAVSAKMTVRVVKSRSTSTYSVRTAGSYASLPANTVTLDEPGQPLYTTASAKAFWLAVLAAVTAQVEALP